MKTLALLLALSGCASIPQGVQMTEAEAAACKAAGCSVWTEAELHALVQCAGRHGHDSVIEGLDSHGCMRSKT